jgi:hypothetical protein
MFDLSVSVKQFWRTSESRQSLDLIERRASRQTRPGRICAGLGAAMFVVATVWAGAQTNVRPSVPASVIALIKSFRIVQEKNGPALEILSTKPLVPSIHALANPPRLVIDLPNARLEALPKRIMVQADQISWLRSDQFQTSPPVARIVLDLEAALPYTWDAAGNRLVVHLGKNASAPDRSPVQRLSVPSLSSSSQPATVRSVRTSELVAIAQNSLAPGASIAAAADTAILGLASGGEVHVCPGTTVSVTSSQTGHNVMLGMSTGAMEAHFALDASSDSIMTPDFRILLTGPGEFHYAFSADHQGNTCVRALPGNTASVMVSELMGDRTYQVKATDQLVFRSGQLDRVDMSVPLECGCPPSREPTVRAMNNLPVDSEPAPANSRWTSAGTIPNVAATLPENKAPSAPAPDLATNHAPPELHMQVEAPFVFHATGPPPPPVEEVRALPVASRPLRAPALSAPLPPPVRATRKPTGTQSASANAAPAGGFFRKLGRFFAAVFR